MNRQEAQTIIERINALDPRIPATTATAQAWFDLINSTVPDMPSDYAMREITTWHARGNDRPIRPADLIQGWRTARQAHGTHDLPTLDSHCKRQGCPCNHTPPCYRGWNDDNPGQFCRTCNPIRQAAIDDMPPAGKRSQFDFDAFTAKAKL